MLTRFGSKRLRTTKLTRKMKQQQGREREIESSERLLTLQCHSWRALYKDENASLRLQLSTHCEADWQEGERCSTLPGASSCSLGAAGILPSSGHSPSRATASTWHPHGKQVPFACVSSLHISRHYYRRHFISIWPLCKSLGALCYKIFTTGKH